MKTTLQNLQTLLKENVAEVVFTRRRPRPNRSPVRRMLCTLDDTILNSENGRLALNFKTTTGIMPYETISKNLLPVWDILMQDWRMISFDNCDIVNLIKREDFWNYYNNTLLRMSAGDKMRYMEA